jgi:hypothetical protein
MTVRKRQILKNMIVGKRIKKALKKRYVIF